MKKFILVLILALTLAASASAASSDDVYLRRDVFEAKMDAFMAEIKLMNQNMRSELKQDINELTKAVAVLSERNDRNFETLSARIDGTNTRIDDLRNGIYLWLVIITAFISFIGVVVAWPKAKEFLQSRKSNKHDFTLDDVEKLVNRLIDAKLKAKSQ